MIDFAHKTVLLEETIDQLQIKPAGIYVDGTLGGGGHSYEIAKRLDGGKLIGIDQDADAIAAATRRLAEFSDRVEIVKSNYKNMPDILGEKDISQVDGIVLDLGVSSFQIDEESRGFSYMKEDAPLDMRMNREEGLTAGDILMTYSYEELVRIFKSYGEERFSGRIAEAIVTVREEKEIQTAGVLNEIIAGCIPKRYQKNGGHPSKRVYQALRIEVNHELSVLEDSVEKMIELLRDGGRLCIITFHSLEDRIVKNAFRTAQDPCICPKELPVCVCGRKSKGKVITRKPIIPSETECIANSRSKSAKLRVFERIFN